MTFTVATPFGPFETGDTPTEAAVFARVPGADLPRLVRLGSLVPADGAAAALVPTPVAAADAELVAGLQARLEEAEADRDLHKEQHALAAADRDALAKRLADLEAKASAPKPARAKGDEAKPPAPPSKEPAPPASGS